MITEQACRRRGRPNAAADRHLGDELLRAAEQCLATKSPDELTRQEIAAAAGTNSAMIGYYFRSKEGLFQALLAALMRDLSTRIDDLDRELAADPSRPTRRIVEALGAAYRANAGACRILAVELTKARSTIKQAYVTRDAARVAERIAALLADLAARGIYDPEADLRKVAITIRLLVTHPLVGPSAWSLLARMDETEDYASWLDHTVDMLDRQLRPRDGAHRKGNAA